MDPAVSVETAMVPDEAQLSEFVHKKIDARARSANHRCQGSLRYAGKPMQLFLIPLARKQKQGAGESLLAVLTQLVD
ncbi:MAG: hypothetical protein WA299_01680 [Candidatus Acidiferrum sp.]